MIRGTQWRSWWRHCTTIHKVAGSIPHGVIGIFYNPSGPTKAVGSIPPLTDVSIKKISGGVKVAGA
jgi:hypothetical protein